MKKAISFILVLGCFSGHAYSPLSCLNQSPRQCTTLLGYAQYAAKGCLYEDNSTSKCKDKALESFCNVKNKTNPLAVLCSGIASRGKMSKLIATEKADLIVILKLIKANPEGVSKKGDILRLREIYKKTPSNLLKALSYEALAGNVGTNG